MTEQQVKYANEILSKLKKQVYGNVEKDEYCQYAETADAVVYFDSVLKDLHLVETTEPLPQGVVKSNKVLIFNPATSVSKVYEFKNADGSNITRSIDVDLIVLKDELDKFWQDNLLVGNMLQIMY